MLQIKYAVGYLNDEEYRVGHGVYLRPDTFKFGMTLAKCKKEKRDKVNKISSQLFCFFCHVFKGIFPTTKVICDLFFASFL